MRFSRKGNQDDNGSIVEKISSRSREASTSTLPVDQRHSQYSENEKDDAVGPTSTVDRSQDVDDPIEGSSQADESQYMHGYRLAFLTLGLLMTVFVVALDTTIIATAIPTITTVFDSLGDIGWYGSAYSLTTTSLQPSFGKLYTYFDVKWVYISALIIFEVGSAICGAATSSTMLIVGRAVAGAGAAGLFSGSMTVIVYAVPLRHRALYLSAIASMNGVASVIGPILGGVFTDNISWRWCFYINLPLGGVGIAIVYFFFTNPNRQHDSMSFRQKVAQIDTVGAATFISAIVCLLLALQWGGTVYSWSTSKVWGCLLGFGLLLIVFVVIQLYLGDKGTMPPRLFKNRSITGVALFSIFTAIEMHTHIYYLPFYFQAVKGTTAEQSGIRNIPYLVSMSLSGIGTGAIVTIFGPYLPPMWIGSALLTVGSGLLYKLGVNSGSGDWVGYQILAGVGMGACIQTPFIALQVVLPEIDVPLGNALAFFFATLGGAISVSIGQNIFTSTLIKQLPVLAPGVDVQKAISSGATGFRHAIPEAQIPGTIDAYAKAVQNTFILPIASSGLAFLSSLLVEWKSVKSKKN